MNRVEVAVEGVAEPSWVDRLIAFALRVLAEEGHDGWDLSILLCDDPTIRDLNARYRDKDEATDVLSFELGDSYQDEEGAERYAAGDIALSLDTLRTNAAYFSVDEDEELRRLVIHGILHLGGQDHGDNEPSQPMLRRQEAILSALSGERVIGVLP